MRESQLPAFGRHCTRRFLVVPVGAFGERARPGLAVILSYRMCLSVLLDEGRNAVNTRSRPAAAVGPGDGIRLVAGYGDGGARLQGKGHHACGATGLNFQLFSKRW